ncbi:MAG: PQQ-dependent sugar dehydrogenase [Bacteroidota bacterium]
MKNYTQQKSADQKFLGSPLLTTVVLFLLFSLSAYAQKPTVITKAAEINIQVLAENLDHPWGMAFLPDGSLLFSERSGTLRIMDSKNKISQPLKGTPEVFATGQGGMLDVALDPEFEKNNFVYVSFSEPGTGGTASTALGRGKLQDNQLKDFEVIFRMEPKVEGPNHFGGRIVFTPEGKILLTLADRFKFDPAQDLSNHMGTIIRINPDGTVPGDNPFTDMADARDEIWSYGHRNIESAAIHPGTGQLWIAEMGPMGGDELNMPEKGKNYGWPEVSHGKNYDGSEIPHPATRPEFEDAKIVWTPTISPSGMIFYTGEMFPEWKNQALIGGLTSTGLVRVLITGNHAEEIERIPLAVRTRDVAQAPDGSIYVLTDEDNGKILRLNRIQ